MNHWVEQSAIADARLSIGYSGALSNRLRRRPSAASLQQPIRPKRSAAISSSTHKRSRYSIALKSRVPGIAAMPRGPGARGPPANRARPLVSDRGHGSCSSSPFWSQTVIFRIHPQRASFSHDRSGHRQRKDAYSERGAVQRTVRERRASVVSCRPASDEPEGSDMRCRTSVRHWSGRRKTVYTHYTAFPIVELFGPVFEQPRGSDRRAESSSDPVVAQCPDVIVTRAS